MSKQSQLQFYLEQQKGIFETISNCVQKLKTSSTITAQRIEARKTALIENWNKFKENHDAAGAIKASLKEDAKAEFAEDPYYQNNMYSECEENYLQAIEEMTIFMDNVQPSVSSTVLPTKDHSFPSHLVRLPTIGLPSFNGEYSNWVQFKDSFLAVIGNHSSLTCVEKLQYLKGCLVGKASQRIQNLSLTAANYEIAWDELVSYYDNKRVLVDSVLTSLFASKPVASESSSELETLYNDTNQALGSLKGLGRDVDKWDDILVHIVSRKLDGASIKEWEKTLGSSKDSPSWASFKDFLITRIRSLQAYERTSPNQFLSSKTLSSSSNKFTGNKTKTHHVSTKPSVQTCSNCKGDHYISLCPVYKSKNVEQRLETLKQLKLCFNCLGFHQLAKCFSKKRCQFCNERHHTSIHPNQQLTPSISPKESSSNTATSYVTFSSKPKAQSVLLTTALVKLQSSTGEFFTVRAFLDQGSEVNLVSEHLTQALQLPRHHSTLFITGIGADSSSTHQSKGTVSLKLSSCVTEFSCNTEAHILPRLTGHLPSITVTPKNWSHLEGIPLADPQYYQPGDVDLILGVQIYGEILKEGLRKGKAGAPIAQNTTLGWIISGAVTSISSSLEAKSYHCHLDLKLDELLTRFWMQEELFQSSSDEMTPEESDCEEIFKSTHRRNENGRYIVRLPFKSHPSTFGNSRTPSLKMLERMQNRFKLNQSFFDEYSKFIQEYEDLGHMSRTTSLQSNCNQPTDVFYLPHHGVVRESSTTTKLRVVFNGSLKTEQGISLNDHLHEGAKLQADLPDVLTRWRQHEFAFSSDIVKMFRQIKIHPDDWTYQRILWYEGKNLVEFFLTTVTYGTSSAPYLANRVIRQLAADEKYRFPIAKELVEENMYVDDIFAGAATIEEGKNKIQQIIDFFNTGCFPLQKWAANNEALLEEVQSSENSAPSTSLTIDGHPIHRTLGLNWQPNLDRFVFNSVGYNKVSTYTKRMVLSQTAQMFDPLGWISPVIIRAKMFIQELWESNLSWDQPIPCNLENRWRNYINQLNDLSLISVPRWIGLSPSSLSVELHGFADASQAAIGAVVYLRVVQANKITKISIIASKSKVTPIRKESPTPKRSRTARITIPRLELSAALLLTRLVSHVRKVFKLESTQIHLWTDSSTTLYWIQGQPSRWKEFIRNRVSQIQDILPEAQWHHLPGEDNPADHASRGLSPRQLSESAIWWNGPPWLSLSSNYWPELIPQINENVDLEECNLIVAATNVKNPSYDWDLIYKYSSLIKLLRITVWCKRAVTKPEIIDEESGPKIIKKSKTLTPEELEEARIFWIKSTQSLYFAPEIHQLSCSKELKSNSPLYRLTPFMDSQGIIRVGGRLRNAKIDPDMKHPIILPRNSPLTTLILDSIHRSTLHGGVQLMLNTLRRKYWIIGGRSPIRCFIHRCVICTRYRANNANQIMGQLPPLRTESFRPFLHSGVDYAGPFTIKTWKGRGAKIYKGYLIVFVCFASSAVHLELSTDYSTEGFIAAYKRFTSRRGICSTLLSDCGTNLIGADAELRKLFNAASKELQELSNLLANNGTKWKFNPPAAPHFGGKWEAAVKSVKFHIKRVVGETVLTYEEFSTLLAQIESVLNSRPICPLSEDPNDFEALTPGHFIIGEALNTIPEPSLAHLKQSRLSRYQLLRQMLEGFWKRWSVEYIQRLQEMVKWHHPSSNIRKGSLVLLKDERYPPSKWPLARVIETHPGLDGFIRVVTIKTQTTTLKRPITKLCVLPISSVKDEIQQTHPDREDYAGNLNLNFDKDRIFDYIRSGRPVTYKVDFPLQSVIPHVSAIRVNGANICSGSKVAAPSTTITLKHTLTASGTSNTPQQPALKRYTTFPPMHRYRTTTTSSPMPRFGYPNFLSSTFTRPSEQFSYDARNPFFNPNNDFHFTFTLPRTTTTERPTFVTRNPPNFMQTMKPAFVTRPTTTSSTTTSTTTARPPPPINTVRPESGPVTLQYLNSVCGRENFNFTIKKLAVHGEIVARARFPWIVALFKKELGSLSFQCGGSLISTRTVISAAHCFYSEFDRIKEEDILVSMGRHNLTDWSDSYITHSDVEKIMLHPDYRPELINIDADLAIVRIKKSVTFSHAIRPVCLWQGPLDVRDIEGVSGIVVGWGRDEDNNDVTTAPRLVTASVATELTCIRSNEQLFYLTSNRTLCAGNRDGSGPCNGDSGSGLMIRNRNKWMIRGTVSAALGSAIHQCNLEEYVVYTDIAKFIGWIQANMLL